MFPRVQLSMFRCRWPLFSLNLLKALIKYFQLVTSIYCSAIFSCLKAITETRAIRKIAHSIVDRRPQRAAFKCFPSFGQEKTKEKILMLRDAVNGRSAMSSRPISCDGLYICSKRSQGKKFFPYYFLQICQEKLILDKHHSQLNILRSRWTFISTVAHDFSWPSYH